MSYSPDGMLQNAACSAVGPSLLATVHHRTGVLAAHKCAALPAQQNSDLGSRAHEVSCELNDALTISVPSVKYVVCGAQVKRVRIYKTCYSQQHMAYVGNFK